MKTIFTFLLSMATVIAIGQVQITFQVDMTGQTVAPEGVHIAGSLNGWNTEANTLEDQGNGIYALTLDLQPGVDYEYKYLNGNAWGTEEAAPAGCTIGGNNRTFTAPTSDMVLAITPFNSCPASVPTQAVTFRVDMTGQTVAGEGVHVAGNFNGWNPGGTPMQAVGGDVYEVTVPVLSSLSVLQYKFINGNAWGGDETPGAGCANGDNNRPYVIANAGSAVTLPTAVFGGCANPVPTKRVIFTADLAGADASAEGVHVAGSFQGWNPEGTPMTDLGDGTYQVEVDVLSTTSYIEYKYLNGNAWGTDEVVPASCSYNNNRFHIVALEEVGPIFLPAFEFGTCNSMSVATNDAVQQVTFEVYPTVADEEFIVTLEAANTNAGTLTVYAVTGEIAYQQRLSATDANTTHRIQVGDWASGLYVIELQSAGSQYTQKVVVR